MIAIIGAMAKEVAALLELLDNPQSKTLGARTFYEGQIKGFPVVITVAGIGKVNASITTTLICEHYHPQLIINVGVAGGVNQVLKTLDIVIGTTVGYHDVDLTIDGNQIGELPDLPRFFSSDEKLVNGLKDFQLKNRKVHCGTILTGDQFVTDFHKVESLINNHYQNQNIMAVDMESAAIAHVAYTFGIPFIIVRSISDLIGSTDQLDEYSNFVEEACLNATEVTKHILSEIEKKR
jgi:adenosylhomocysteine nucleosidase